jgi:murein DD-endopeptidase MepM/ murein hydrolase activator NlpD
MASSRNIGSLLDPEKQLHTVSLPDPASLSQNVGKHLESIQSNVMTGYANVMQTIQANDEARSADYNYRMKKAQLEAEKNGASGGIGSALADISKTLLEAYSSFQEADLVGKELDLKATQAERAYAASQQDAEARQAAAQQKAEIEAAKQQSEATKAALIGTIDQMVTQTQGFIRDYGYTEGVNKAQTQLEALFQSDVFKGLTPEDQVQVRTYYRSHFGDIQQNQTTQAVQQQKEYEAQQVDTDIAYIRINYGAAAFADIENGVDPNAAVAKLEEGVAAWKKSVEERTGKPMDATYMMKVVNPIYADLATRLEKMYGSRASSFSTAGKYKELSEYAQGMWLAQQQQVVNPNTGQPFTQAEVATLIEQKGIGLGIPSYVDRLEVTPSKITERQITQLEQAKNLEALLNSNDSPIDPNSIMGKSAIGASTGSVLYSFVNRDPGTLAYVAHIKNNRNQYPVHLQNIPELADSFAADRQSYTDLGKQLLALEQKAYALTPKVEPETLGQRRTLVPPNPELGTGGGFVDVSGSPSPTALKEERESILKQMDALKSQQVELQSKWMSFGLDVTNPANKGYLEELQVRAAGVQAKADQEGVGRLNTNPNRTPGVTITEPRDAQSIRNRAVNNASRRARTGRYDDKGEEVPATVRVMNNFPKELRIAEAYSGLDKVDSHLNQLERTLAQGVNPDEALKQIQQSYKNTRTTPRQGHEEIDNKLNTYLLREFTRQSTQLVDSYKHFLKQFQTVRPAEAPRNPSGGSTTDTPNRSYPLSNGEYERRNGIVTPFKGSNHQIASTPDTSFGIPNAVTFDVTGKQNVHALSDGKVVYIGTQNGKPVTIVKTHNGVYEGYVGIVNQYRKVGDNVTANSPLGKVGSGSGKPKPLGDFLKNPIRDIGKITLDQDYATQEGQENKYRDHRGVDIMVPEGTPVFSPVSGSIVYSEAGHTRITEDSMRSQPGHQPQYSVLIKLDKPIDYNGKTYNMVYLTHLGGLSGLKPGERVTTETQLGISGTAVAPHIHLGLIGDRQQTTYVPEGTLYQQLLAKEQSPSSFSIVTWGSNPVFQNGMLSPNTTSAEQYLQTKTGAYYPPNNRNRQGQSSNNIFKLTKDTYLLSNGRILDLKTNTVREATQSETATMSSGYKPSVVSTNGFLSTNSADYGAGKNNPDEDYGYKVLKDDPEFRKELANLADELGIPAVFLADVMQVETGNWTHVRRANQWGYYGLIQISPTNAKAYANMTTEQIGKLSLGQQVRLVVRPYLLAMQREAGKPIKTMEDLLFSIWRGSPGLKMNNQRRAATTDGLNGTTARQYLNQLGQAAGRQYGHFMRQNTGRALHKESRGGCPTCQAMKQKGTFVVHYG